MATATSSIRFSKPQQAYMLARAYYDVVYNAHLAYGRKMDVECDKLGIPTPYGILPEGHPMWAEAQKLLDRENAAKKLMYDAAHNLIDWAIDSTLARCGTAKQKSDIRAMAAKVKTMCHVEQLWIDLVDCSMRLSTPDQNAHLMPVIYEIAPNSGESTGTVHFFCSAGCMAQSIDDEAIPKPFVTGADELPNHGLICESCGKSLD